MEIKRTYEGFQIFHDHKEQILIPWDDGHAMRLQPGEFKVEEVKENERGLWVARSFDDGGKDLAMVFYREPTANKDGWDQFGYIRSFCWDIFSNITGIVLEKGEAKKYLLK